MALDDGNITGYESAVAQNYIENDLDIPEAVAEPLIETFETADLTSAGVLGWLTGHKHRQLNGEHIKIIAKFDHECQYPKPGTLYLLSLSRGQWHASDFTSKSHERL